MEKEYIVVYLSAGGMHYNFRCVAKDKRQAKKECRECMGVSNEDITDVYENPIPNETEFDSVSSKMLPSILAGKKYVTKNGEE